MEAEKYAQAQEGLDSHFQSFQSNIEVRHEASDTV